MVNAYVRRKQWETRLLAVAVVNTLGESISGDNETQEKKREDTSWARMENRSRNRRVGLLEFERIARGTRIT